jgi:hypothetical protein
MFDAHRHCHGEAPERAARFKHPPYTKAGHDERYAEAVRSAQLIQLGVRLAREGVL